MSGTKPSKNIEKLPSVALGLTLFADGTLSILSCIQESDAALALYAIAASFAPRNTNPTDQVSPNDNENKESETTADYHSNKWQCSNCGHWSSSSIDACHNCGMHNLKATSAYPPPNGDNKVYAVVSTHEASTGIPAGIFSTVEFANEYINGRDNPEEWGITPYVVDWRRPN